MHPYERFMDHIEVDYSQRMCTVIRARVGDFNGDMVILRVKGKGGRKTMLAPKHEDTDAIIAEVSSCDSIDLDIFQEKIYIPWN